MALGLDIGAAAVCDLGKTAGAGPKPMPTLGLPDLPPGVEGKPGEGIGVGAGL